MPTTVRALMLVQVAVFWTASLIHQGFLLDGFQDPAAAIAEGVIGAVLAAGLALGWAIPAIGRRMALLAQLFALAGTSIGVFLLIRGVGPGTPLDVAIHATMVVLLVAGLWLAWTHGRDRRTAAAA
jgi:hypothetical protein